MKSNSSNQKNSISNKRSFTPQKKDVKKTVGNSSSSKGVINLSNSQSNSNVIKFSNGRAGASSVSKIVVKKRTYISDKNLINASVNGFNLYSTIKKKK